MLRFLNTLIALLSTMLIPHRVLSSALGKAGGGRLCDCVPDQWEGVLSSFEREFDLREAQTEESETKIRVHYDYTHQKFAMVDEETGKRAIADYKQGYKYMIGREGCFQVRTEEVKMKRMCLPDEAEFLGRHILATNVPVGFWEFSSPFNLTTRTMVTLDNCLPISEDIFMAKGAHCSSTHSLYLDMTVGIHNASVFIVPESCDVEHDDDVTDDVTDDEIREISQVAKKRAVSSFSEAILKQLYH